MICAEDTRNEMQDTGVDILGKASVIALSRCDDGEKAPKNEPDAPSTGEELQDSGVNVLGKASVIALLRCDGGEESQKDEPYVLSTSEEPPKKKQKTTSPKESPTVSDSEADEIEPPSNSLAINNSNYNDKDVLSGRGGGTNLHPGNRYYRELIFNHRKRYDEASKAKKPDVSREVVKMLRDSGGRFLRKDDQGLYHDIGDTAAREKTSQALRHRTFEMRNKEEGKDNSDSKKKANEDADTELFKAKKKIDGIGKSGAGGESIFFAGDSEAGPAAGASSFIGGLQEASIHASLREKVYIESTLRMKMMEFEIFQQARAESEFNSLHMVARAREHAAMAREAQQLCELQESRQRNEAIEMNEALIMLSRREAVVAEEAEMLRRQRITLQMEASTAPVRSMPMLDPRSAAARFPPYQSPSGVGKNPNLFW